MKVLVINSDNKMSVKELDNFKDIQKIGDNRQNLSKRRNTAIKKRIKERNR